MAIKICNYLVFMFRLECRFALPVNSTLPLFSTTGIVKIQIFKSKISAHCNFHQDQAIEMLTIPSSKNMRPRTSRAQDLKPWQKLAVARAAQNTLETMKTDNTGKEALALRSFVANCDTIIKNYQHALPYGCTKEILVQDGARKDSCLTGKQVWSSWDSLSREVALLAPV